MKKNKTVVCVFVYRFFPDITGGAEKQARLQAIELARRGYSCTILASRSSFRLARYEFDVGCRIVRITLAEAWANFFLRNKPRAEGNNLNALPVIETPTAEALGVDWAARLVRWLNALFFMVGSFVFFARHRREFSILHTHIADWNAGFAGWIGYVFGIPVLAKAAFLPAFPEIKDIPLASYWDRWRKRINYIAMTDEMADDMVACGLLRARLRVIPNGVPDASGAAIPAESLKVLFVGNLTQGAAHKAFDVLLDAWALTAPHFPDARLQIAGNGSPVHWYEYARKLGCGSQVDFLGFQKDMSACYMRAGLFVLPSRGEGISNALLEAMSFGLPSIVSDIPGNRAVVRNGLDGIIVTAGDANALAEALKKMLRTPRARKSMGESARERVRSEFGLSRVVDAVEKYYSDLLIEHNSLKAS